MNNLRGLKQKLSTISRLRDEQDYQSALAEVESLLQSWPGNAHLHVLFAQLVQLQKDTKYTLEEAKQALQQAVELDKTSPAAAIELGCYLDNVEDDPNAAGKAFAEGIATARHLLIDALIGQAKVLRQLDRREEFLRCLLEVLHLARFEAGARKTKAEGGGPGIIFESPAGHFHTTQLNGPFAEQIQDLLNGVVADRSA